MSASAAVLENPAAARDGRGRFQPGCSGNPAGKKPGTRNKATLLKQLFRDGEPEAAGRLIIDEAVGGNVAAAKFIYDRIDPKPRARPVAIDLPDDAGPADLLAVYDATLRAMIAGEIAPAEALAITKILEGRARLLGAPRAPDLHSNCKMQDHDATEGSLSPRERDGVRGSRAAAALPETDLGRCPSPGGLRPPPSPDGRGLDQGAHLYSNCKMQVDAVPPVAPPPPMNRHLRRRAAAQARAAAST